MFIFKLNCLLIYETEKLLHFNIKNLLKEHLKVTGMNKRIVLGVESEVNTWNVMADIVNSDC